MRRGPRRTTDTRAPRRSSRRPPPACAAVINKRPLASDMQLPHRRRQALLPAAVEIAVTAVAVPIGIGFPIFLPGQLQRHTWPAELAMNRRPLGLRSPILRRDRRRRVHEPLDRLIA